MKSASRAILLTPPGAAAIAVVRLTGPKVADFLAAHFSRPVAAGRCVHGELSAGGQVIDDPVVVLSSDGRCADVNLHGGPWIVRSMLEAARRNGFDARESIELPLPPEAIDAETDLQREILAHLPLARTELAIETLLAQAEAWKGLEQLPAADLRSRAGAMLGDLSLFHLLHPPRVAIAGAANVGKSTLANQLFAQERSITADLPGTTRDWVGEIANLDGLAVMLVDTPGIRATDDPIESRAIERGGDELRAADLVILVLDATRPFEPEQREMVARFPRSLRVINKSDLPAQWDPRVVDGLPIIATTGKGMDALRAAVKAHFGIGAERARACWWTPRQREWVESVSIGPATAECPERSPAETR